MILEFQSSVDYRMPIRLLLYMIEIWREVLKNTTDKEFNKILIKLLTQKFKNLPEKYIENIKTMPDEIVEAITLDIFDIEKVEELEKYF